MIFFDFPRLTGFQDLETFYIDLINSLKNSDSEGATFDLRATDFFPPEALLSLAVLSRLWNKKTGQPVTWKLDNQETICYLERMDVFSVFANSILPPKLPTTLWSRASSNNLMELQSLSADPQQNNLVDVPKIVSIVRDLLLGRVSPSHLSAAGTLLSEVAQNVVHSGNQGFTLSQIYHAGRGHRAHIGVADLGIGIPASLRAKYPNVGQPSDYLRKALEAGVTSQSTGGGLGLHQVHQLVKNGGGTLTIRSDTAMLQLYNGRFYQWDDLAHIPGTQVFLTIWGRHDPGQWNYLLPSQ